MLISHYQIYCALRRIKPFETIDLKTLEKVELLNRIDSKFVFPISDLQFVLNKLQNDYFLLSINELKIHSYRNLYYDTPEFQLYKMHHNGKLNRLKVRMRQYADTGLTFFEAKYKVKATRTDKVRLKLKEWDEPLTEEKLNCVSFPGLNERELEPKIRIDFYRITFARKDFGERATFDIQLKFYNNNKSILLDNMVIAEVKQSKQSAMSPMLDCFRKLHFEECGFSKYSMATASLELLKYNTFKPNFIKINKLKGNKFNFKPAYEPIH